MRKLHTHSPRRCFDFPRTSGIYIGGIQPAKNPASGRSEVRGFAGDEHAGLELGNNEGMYLYMCEKRMAHFRNTSPAFTRLELLACVAGFALLLAIITPALANSRSRSDRVACLSNLRQIGNAFRQFALEHNDTMPWRQQAGSAGNYTEPGKHELWFQYWWLRESIGSPRLVMDPAETRSSARIANSWGLELGSGLQNLKNRGVAYVLGIDGSTDVPRSMLVADRNILLGGFGGCSTSLSTAAQVLSTTRWFDDVHGTSGNIAFADGSVDSVDTDGLLRALAESRDVGGTVHVMTADFQP